MGGRAETSPSSSASRVWPTPNARMSTPASAAATTAMPRPHQPSTMNPATASSQPSESGIRYFQPSVISWS